MRVLIIGLGSVGQRHARNLRRLLGDEVDLIAVRRRGGGPALTDALRPRNGVSPEESLGIRVFGDLDAALGEHPDALIIADPTSMHLATASASLAAECAMLVEKPLSHSWDGVPAFLADAQRHDAPILVGYQLRYHPLLLRLGDLVHDGSLGSVISATCTYGEYLPSWHPYEDYREGYAARRDLGGGVMLTQIHDIDYLGWILGWPAQVFSVGGHLSHLQIDVDDASSTLWPCAVDGRRVPVQLRQDYVRRAPVRTLELVMDAGALHLDLLLSHLRAWDGDARCVVDDKMNDYDRNEAFLSEMRHFLACVDGRETPRVPPAEAAKSLAVALAALRSQSSGRLEDVLYPEEPVAATTSP